MERYLHLGGLVIPGFSRFHDAICIYKFRKLLYLCYIFLDFIVPESSRYSEQEMVLGSYTDGLDF